MRARFAPPVAIDDFTLRFAALPGGHGTVPDFAWKGTAAAYATP